MKNWNKWKNLRISKVFRHLVSYNLQTWPRVLEDESNENRLSTVQETRMLL